MTAIISDSQFLEVVQQLRIQQMQQYGPRPDHSIERWVTIIVEEVGKLAKAGNAVSEAVGGHVTIGEADFLQLQMTARKQLAEVAACCLAALQECPALRPVANGYRRGSGAGA